MVNAGAAMPTFSQPRRPGSTSEIDAFVPLGFGAGWELHVLDDAEDAVRGELADVVIEDVDVVLVATVVDPDLDRHRAAAHALLCRLAVAHRESTAVDARDELAVGPVDAVGRRRPRRDFEARGTRPGDVGPGRPTGPAL